MTAARQMRWYLINGFFLFIMYQALVLEIAGWQNVLLFSTWLLFLMTVAGGERMEKLVRKTGRSVPVQIESVYEIVVTLIFIFHGWWWTGIAYLIHACLLQAWLGSAEKKTHPQELPK
jgi:hypothetical protein